MLAILDIKDSVLLVPFLFVTLHVRCQLTCIQNINHVYKYKDCLSCMFRFNKKKNSSILRSLAISLDDQVHTLIHSVNDFIDLFRGKVDHCVIYSLRKCLIIFSSYVIL